MTKKPKSLIIDRTLRVLLAMAEQGRPLGVSELGRQLDIPKATVHRILSTLSDNDFVIKDPASETFTLGAGVLRLSDRMRFDSTLLTVAQPFLEGLAQQTGEVANLGILYHGKVLVLTNVAGSRNQILIPQLGPIAELHSSSLGKALLLDKSAEEVASLLGKADLPAFTPNTARSLEDLLSQLKEIRSSGVAMDNEETEMGLVCYGAPISDWKGEIIAAISVSAPKARLNPAREDEIRAAVSRCASDLMARLAGGRKDDGGTRQPPELETDPDPSSHPGDSPSVLLHPS